MMRPVTVDPVTSPSRCGNSSISDRSNTVLEDDSVGRNNGVVPATFTVSVLEPT